MDETIIVTYSPKYKAYQQKIRSRQLDRAQKIVEGKIKKRKGKTQNAPTRFVKETNCTSDGEIAEKTIYELDQNRIAEEAKYDGFYAVITNLEDNVEEILKKKTTLGNRRKLSNYENRLRSTTCLCKKR